MKFSATVSMLFGDLAAAVDQLLTALRSDGHAASDHSALMALVDRLACAAS